MDFSLAKQYLNDEGASLDGVALRGFLLETAKKACGEPVGSQFDKVAFPLLDDLYHGNFRKEGLRGISLIEHLATVPPQFRRQALFQWVKKEKEIDVPALTFDEMETAVIAGIHAQETRVLSRDDTKLSNVVAVIVFGSFARGMQRGGNDPSDIDGYIIVRRGEKTDVQEFISHLSVEPHRFSNEGVFHYKDPMLKIEIGLRQPCKLVCPEGRAKSLLTELLWSENS